MEKWPSGCPSMEFSVISLGPRYIILSFKEKVKAHPPKSSAFSIFHISHTDFVWETMLWLSTLSTKKQSWSWKKLHFFVENSPTKPRSHGLSDKKDRWDWTGTAWVTSVSCGHFFSHHKCPSLSLGGVCLKNTQISYLCKHPIGARLCIDCIIKDCVWEPPFMCCHAHAWTRTEQL